MLLTIFTIVVFIVIEGLGMMGFNYFYYQYFLLFFPILLYSYVLFAKKEKLHLPLFLVLCYVFYIIFTFISSLFFSLDKQASFEKTLTIVGLLIFYIFIYNFKKIGEKLLSLLPFLGGGLCLTYLLLFYFKKIGWNLLPITEKQFIWPIFTGHNHLGDFLGLGIIVLIWNLTNKRKEFNILGIIFFLAFFILAFSRSAYMSLSATVLLIIIFSKNKTILKIGGTVLIFLLVFFTVLVSSNFKLESLNGFKEYVYSNLNFGKRELFEGRSEYVRQSIMSFQERPLFGVGMDNFAYASFKYSDKYIMSGSAHNIFAEILTENGLPALVFFLLFVFLIIYQIFKNPSLAGLLFLYLLINFQTDYTYQIYSFQLLFILTAALSLGKTKEKTIVVDVFGVVSLLLFVVLTAIITCAFFLKINESYLAYKVYPLDKSIYPELIKKEVDKKDFIKAEEWIIKYEKVAPYDEQFIYIVSNYYLNRGNKKKALYYLMKGYQIRKYINVEKMKQIYFLKKEIVSDTSSEEFLQDVMKNWRKIPYSEPFAQEFRDFCYKIRNDVCYEVGWDKKSN